MPFVAFCEMCKYKAKATEHKSQKNAGAGENCWLDLQFLSCAMCHSSLPFVMERLINVFVCEESPLGKPFNASWLI